MGEKNIFSSAVVLEQLAKEFAVNDTTSHCTNAIEFFDQVSMCDDENQYDKLIELFEVEIWEPFEHHYWKAVIEAITGRHDTYLRFGNTLAESNLK